MGTVTLNIVNRTSLLLLALGTLVSCGRETADVNTKLVGVGRHPDDIGPAAKEYGGFVDYNLLEFAGGGLSMGAAGFGLYDEITPANILFKPPYALVSGMGFIFDAKVPAPDAAHGNFGVPPKALDTCWTDYEPRSLLSASPVDVGAWVKFRTEGSSTAFEMERYPVIYPPDPQDVFTYYIGVSPWRAKALTGWAAGETSNPVDMSEQVLVPVNFTPESRMYFEFPGGISPLEAPVGSIPMPSAVAAPEGPVLKTPGLPGGVMLSWDGVSYDFTGAVAEESGAHTACVRYYGGDAPEELSDCEGASSIPLDEEEVPGQIYTGPWDSEDGVTFRWAAPETEEETGAVVLNIRFLAQVDRTAESFSDGLVKVDADQDIEDKWATQQANGNVEGDLPQGYRPALACDEDEDVEYLMNPTLVEADGDNVTSLRGDPSFNLVEVSCRLQDDGEFTMASDKMSEAIAYAHAKQAGGAMFYFGRYTEAEMSVPDAKDQTGNRKVITPIILKSHALKIGRFWFEPTDEGGE